MADSLPEFGVIVPTIQYVPRPGAYAILFDSIGRLAVMRTPRGCFLPGGGAEGTETAEDTVRRETREECGVGLASVTCIGTAIEYVHTEGHSSGIRKLCTFFTAKIGNPLGEATEQDHELVWMDPHQAISILTHHSQRWAVAKTIDASNAS